MSYYVSRQLQWPDGVKMVEINGGGADYANPDQLAAKYKGEGKEYLSPVDAVEVALAIADQWRKDSGDVIEVGHGFTGGATMPFDADNADDLRKWADSVYENMPKCDNCNDPLPCEREQYRMADDWSGERFCSERCCDQAIAWNEQCLRESEADEANSELSE